MRSPQTESKNLLLTYLSSSWLDLYTVHIKTQNIILKAQKYLKFYNDPTDCELVQLMPKYGSGVCGVSDQSNSSRMDCNREVTQVVVKSFNKILLCPVSFSIR